MRAIKNRPLLFAFLLLAAPAAAAPPGYSDPSVFLKPGTQSYISPEQFALIKKEAGISDQELGKLAMVGKVYARLGRAFANKTDGGASIGKNTAESLLEEKNLYGCTDWALLAAALLRAGGVPARMADAVGIGWMEDYRRTGGKAGGFHGHVFVEAYVDGGWILIEHNSRNYFSGYDPADPVIPMKVGPEKKGFYVMRKGADPAGYGITGVRQLNELMKEYALSDLGKLVPPRYAAAKLPYN
jgi:hypothetical protein